MKPIYFSILISLLVCFTGCEKLNDSNFQDDGFGNLSGNLNSKQYLLGKWINQLDNKDILYFKDDGVSRTHYATNELDHFYSYKIKGDKLELQYLGHDKIYVYPRVFDFNIDNKKGILQIKDFNNYYPGGSGGDIFLKEK